MQNLWQKKLKLTYNKEKVIDIIQFGSSVLEGSSPNDIDIGVIFKKIPLKEQLIISQEIKQQLKKYTEIELHISSFDFYSFFDRSNFAREGAFFYSKSLITKKPFSNFFGLEPYVIIGYSLENLKKKEKIKFNYLLNGRQGKYGLLRQFHGNLVAPGVIQISPEHENIFLDKMKKITDRIFVERVFKQIGD